MAALGNPGRGHVRQSDDSVRVLGQITRGETYCGPAAAREIAARHQKAYGNTVWGPAPEATPNSPVRDDT